MGRLSDDKILAEADRFELYPGRETITVEPMRRGIAKHDLARGECIPRTGTLLGIREVRDVIIWQCLPKAGALNIRKAQAEENIHDACDLRTEMCQGINRRSARVTAPNSKSPRMVRKKIPAKARSGRMLPVTIWM